MNELGPFARPPAAPSFYPITIGRGVSLAFSLFRFGWRTFIAINLVAVVPAAIISMAGDYLTGGGLYAWQDQLIADATSGTQDSAAVLTAVPWPALGALVLATFLAVPFSALGGGALIDAIASAIAGDRLSARGSLAAAMGRLGSLLGLYLLVAVPGLAGSLLAITLPLLPVLPGALNISGGPLALLGLIGFVALVFALVFVLIRIYFATQALMIERLPVVDAFRRSWSLLDGAMLRVVGWALVFGIILGLIGFLLTIAASFVAVVVAPPEVVSPGSLGNLESTTLVVQTLITTLVTATLEPIAIIGLTLLYFEIRWRRGEGVPSPGQSPASGPPPTA